MNSGKTILFFWVRFLFKSRIYTNNLIINGLKLHQDFLKSFRKERTQSTHARFGRCRQDHYPLQTQVRRSCLFSTHHRIQRRDRLIPKGQIHSLGCRRTRQDQTIVEALLSKHSSSHLCCWLIWQRKSGCCQRRTPKDAFRRRT